MAQHSSLRFQVKNKPRARFCSGRAVPQTKEEEHTMTGLKYPQWQRPYRAALLETDPPKLHEKLMQAENAIFLRPSRTDHHEERLAINDAISALRSLQTTKLNFPNGRSE